MPHPQSSLPKAILHIDGDAFFASCEQAVNPAYKGKPVITGKERGIVATASYEAKAMGIKRGVPLWEVRKLCPNAIILPSNYETYSLFSKRMFSIIRRFTSAVEEYSIDEAFADITGLRRPYRKSYEEIAQVIKQSIELELGITVSLGLASTKVLAKVGSKWNKPSGFVVIRNRNIVDYLSQLKAVDIWGIGPQTAAHLQKYGIHTAWQFARRPFEWVERFLTKPHQEIWHELNGTSVFPIATEEKHDYASISKTKTFTPPSTNKLFVFGQLSKNVENAFIKLRRHNLAARKIIIYLKTQDFRYRGLEISLNRPTSFPNEAMPLVQKMYEQVFEAHTEYRATGVVLWELQPDDAIQMNLFESPLTLGKQERIFTSIDELAQKYGKHTVFLGSSLPAHQVSQHQSYRGHVPAAKLQRTEDQIHQRKFLNLPLWLGSVR